MTIFTYYNEPLDEIAGRSRFIDWTGQENPSSETLERAGIYTVAIPDDKINQPFELKKEGNQYVAVYPVSSLPKFGYLSESERGNAITITQTVTPGQLIHKPKGVERVTISAINDLPADVQLSVRWGEALANYRLRAFSGITTLPTLYVGQEVEISCWADTPGVLIVGGWEG